MSASAAVAAAVPVVPFAFAAAALFAVVDALRFEASRFPLGTPEPLAGPKADFSFWLVTVLEASERESSGFRGRAGGMAFQIVGLKCFRVCLYTILAGGEHQCKSREGSFKKVKSSSRVALAFGIRSQPEQRQLETSFRASGAWCGKLCL